MSDEVTTAARAAKKIRRDWVSAKDLWVGVHTTAFNEAGLTFIVPMTEYIQKLEASGILLPENILDIPLRERSKIVYHKMAGHSYGYEDLSECLSRTKTLMQGRVGCIIGTTVSLSSVIGVHMRARTSPFKQGPSAKGQPMLANGLPTCILAIVSCHALGFIHGISQGLACNGIMPPKKDWHCSCLHWGHAT